MAYFTKREEQIAKGMERWKKLSAFPDQKPSVNVIGFLSGLRRVTKKEVEENFNKED